MKPKLWLALIVSSLIVCGEVVALAQQPLLSGPGKRYLAGVDLGATGALAPVERFVENGATFSPFVGYMHNNYIGALGNLHMLALPNKDRPGILDDDVTWAVGGTIGPRFALPLGGLEVWGTWQGGVYTGLAPNSAITDTSWGFSTGGGANLRFTERFSIGGFGRYNRLYQRAHGEGDVRIATGGISFTFDFPVAKPAPQVAEAPPPAPPAPAPPPPEPPVKKKVVLRGVNFDFDSAAIRADARPVLDEAIQILQQEPNIIVVAEGHTDAMGTDEYNLQLSRDRASAVAGYLAVGGIPASRLRIQGFGESRPVATNETEDGRAQNRRVELRVME
jgi:OOP family OmpA-OmpF porin